MKTHAKRRGTKQTPAARYQATKAAQVQSRIKLLDKVVEELAIVQPRIVVVIGEQALEELNDLGVPLGREQARLVREREHPFLEVGGRVAGSVAGAWP